MSGFDFALETTWDFKFTTRQFSDGVPTTLAGTPVVDIYEDNSLTQITGAETLTVDFDGVTGLHNLRIAITAANGFATDSSYSAVITTGTVGGTSVVGEVLCNFTVEKQSALRPTVAGRTLDVTAAGEAGIDLDNTSGTLAAAQIAADAITAAKIAAGAITSSEAPNLDAAVSSRLAPTVAARTLDVAATGEAGVDFSNINGTLDAAEIGTDAITAAKIAAGAITSSEAPNLDAAVSSRLAPTVAARTLDVSVAGNAGIDWGNVENPTTVLDLSGTDINLVDTTTTNTDMRGTENAALASVLGALADVAADGDPTAVDTVMQYVKQLINILVGTAGVVTFPAAAAPGNGVSLAEAIREIFDDVTGLNGDVMRGTNSAALASVATEARLAELDAANLPTDIANVQSDTDNIQTRLPVALVGGAMDSDISNMQANVLDANALAADAVDEIRDGLLPTQNVAFSDIYFLFVDSTDHVTPVTGATGTGVTRSIDGGAFGAGTGTLAEVGNGIYQYDASAADMNGGKIQFRFTASGGTPNAPDDAFVTLVTGGGV